MKNALIVPVCLLAAMLSACGRGRPPVSRTPVEEVSVATSGVELKENASAGELSEQWPSWRGANNDGISVSGAAPIRWSASEAIKWMVNVPGRGHSSPIVVGDTVLLATADDAAQTQSVLAFDRASGETRWEKLLHKGNFPSKSEVHEKGSNANSTLASDGQRAFIAFFNNGKVTATALDMSGEVVWQKELGAFSSKFGFAPSPITYKSFVIFAVDNWGGGYISALDCESGEVAWRISRDAKNSHSTPLIANVGGKEQLLISGCDKVASYDPASGEENWSIDATSETTCGTMVTSGDLVYASGGYPDKQTICLTAEGEKVWDNRVKIYEPSLLAVDGNIYAVSDNGIAYCWSGSDGKELWKERLGGSFSSSPVFCNGNIYASSLDKGKTHVFKASSAGYEEIAVNTLGSDCYASPAILDGEIFMRVGEQNGGTRQEKLVCISN